MSKKLKVCFFIPDMIIGGVETVFTNTLDMLLKNTDWDICVFTHADLTEPYYKKWFHDRPQIKMFPVYKLNSFFERYKKKFGFPIENIRKIVFSIYKKYCRFKLTNINSYDIIVDYANCSAFKLIKNFKNTKITWLHGSIDYVRNNKLFERFSIYDKIICISDSLKIDLTEELPEYADKLVRIYNPVDYAAIKIASRTAPKYDGKYFLCVGRLDRDKDISTIIRAFNKFWTNENKPDVKMVFVGDGSIANDMKKMASATDAHDQFVFLGKIPKPYGYMRGAMAHILSSYNEGLPTVLIEAMATDTINISSNCPNGPHEILLDGDAGILFTPGNADELATAMSNVYKGRVDIAAITKRATESLARFNIEKICKQIIDLITEQTK